MLVLRDFVSEKSRAPGGAAAAAIARHRPRLLIIHHGDPRLAALELVLGELGYEAAVVATAEEAIAAIVRGPQPDVLLAVRATGSARRGVAFARDCPTRWPALRALYVRFIPCPGPDALNSRERVLAAPFNAEQMAAALTSLWPGTESEH